MSVGLVFGPIIGSYLYTMGGFSYMMRMFALIIGFILICSFFAFDKDKPSNDYDS
jgi:MFS family permease